MTVIRNTVALNAGDELKLYAATEKATKTKALSIDCGIVSKKART